MGAGLNGRIVLNITGGRGGRDHNLAVVEVEEAVVEATVDEEHDQSSITTATNPNTNQTPVPR